MIGPILQHSDLKKLCRPDGNPSRATVEEWAKRCGIRYAYDGNGGIWTTLDALNHALGLNTAAANDAYDAEII
ncbi:hypothetical protein CO615_04705 [Lysobacteraceae bacterium NML75-0749]|nr:hypothetical protein CO615_04705 [Xanthomonadaceae bacterium NML75-0749]